MEVFDPLVFSVRLAVLETKVTLLLGINAAIGIALIGQFVSSVANHLRNNKGSRGGGS